MIIKTYKELNEFFEMFKKQNVDLLIVMSKAGYGKTTILKDVMKRTDYVYVSTHSTPLTTYLKLFEHIDCPVIFDDLNDLFNNNIMVSMLKSLADTSPIKEIFYGTTSSIIGNAPSSFKTTSNTCILLNEFDIHNRTLAPLIDRAFYIEFTPDKKEILNKIREISKSQNISNSSKCVLEFVEEHYKKIDNLSLRTYIKALQLHMDNPKKWKENFMKMIGFDEKLVEFIKLRGLYKTDNEGIKHYRWSRATYFRVKKELEDD